MEERRGWRMEDGGWRMEWSCKSAKVEGREMSGRTRFKRRFIGIPRTLCTGRLAFSGHGAAFNGDASRGGEWAIE